MCLVAIFHRVAEDATLVVGANREEAYARGGEAPHVQAGGCRFIAGRDPQAGGVWLGVNEHGVLIAVTNRKKLQPPARPRSRGLLARDLLGCSTAGEAVELAKTALDGGHYAGCNVVAADQQRVTVIHAADWLRIRPLPPGIHVLTANDVNDESDWRIGYSLWWLIQRQYTKANDCIAALKELCSQTGGSGGPAICLRGDDRGTVSSSILALRSPLQKSELWHAQGAPDRTPYENLSSLFQGLA
jgi:uncharacterized protein with NRDE domain